jgi:hypothetical protein
LYRLDPALGIRFKIRRISGALTVIAEAVATLMHRFDRQSSARRTIASPVSVWRAERAFSW